MNRIILIFIGFLMTTTIANAQLSDKIQINTEYTTASGLKIKFTVLNPDNAKPAIGDKVKVHYTGKLTNDTVFDSSVKRGVPLEFPIGVGKVVKGWDEGILYLHKGDKAVLTIPPDLGYGAQANGKIPANSTLIFDVELVDFTPAPIPPKPYDTKGKDTVKLADGLAYIIVTKGSGEKIEAGMNVNMHYTGFLEDGKIFDSSVQTGEPITVPVGAGKLIKGWDEGLTYLHVGDKARLMVPYMLAFGEAARGPIPAKANLIFDIEIIKAEKSKTPVPYVVTGKDTLTTASGLKYIVVKAGTGTQAVKGKKVKVDYTGYFTSGKIFDSSIQNGEPYSFTLGNGEVIPGWDEGIALMKVGAQLRLIVPYTLAYGEKDYGPIPGKSTLIFDVELIDVK